jgi:predicted DNA-binding transcriptional regulator AlpA
MSPNVRRARTEDRRLGIAELAARLGVSGRTIGRWCVAGSFPRPSYIGLRRKWLLSDVETWEVGHTGRPAELERRVANLAVAHDRGRRPPPVPPAPPPPRRPEGVQARSAGIASVPRDPTLEPGVDPSAMGAGSYR